MNRRELIKNGLLAGIFGLGASKVEAFTNKPSVAVLEPFLKSKRLHNAVWKLHTRGALLYKYPFLKRTHIATVAEEELNEFAPKMFVADIISSDNGILANSQYEVTSSIPSIKIAHNLSTPTQQRIAKHDGGDISKLEVLQGWERNLSELLLNGMYQRLNSVICNSLTNRSTVYDRLGIMIGQPFVVPELTVQADKLTYHDLDVLRLRGADRGVLYDRLTISPEALEQLGKLEEVKSNNLLRLKEVEVTDASYKERVNTTEAKINTVRVLPKNIVILSSRALDNHPESFDFGYIENSFEAYYTSNHDSGKQAWANIKGWPRKHNKALTASIELDTSRFV
jgi:hypothetical protein